MWTPCVRVSTVSGAGGRGVPSRAGGCAAPIRAAAPRGRAGPGPEMKGKGRTTGMTDATLDLATVWDQIRERLATSLSPQQNAMLNLTRPLGLVEDTAVLAAPNEFTQTVLESRMRRVLSEALSEQFGRDIRVAVQLEDAPAPQPPAAEEQPPVRRAWSPAEAARVQDDEERAREDDGRSAFGVRTDARPVWERDERLAGADRGAPEDWSPAVAHV